MHIYIYMIDLFWMQLMQTTVQIIVYNEHLQYFHVFIFYHWGFRMVILNDQRFIKPSFSVVIIILNLSLKNQHRIGITIVHGIIGGLTRKPCCHGTVIKAGHLGGVRIFTLVGKQDGLNYTDNWTLGTTPFNQGTYSVPPVPVVVSFLKWVVSVTAGTCE